MILDIIEAIKTRRSVRGFKPDPVPRPVLESILDAAIRAPSARNTQPWEIIVVTGRVLEQLKQGNVEQFKSGGRPNLEVQDERFEGEQRERQNELARQVFGAMNIERGDLQGRDTWRKHGFRFHDAPAGIIICVDGAVNRLHSQFSVGALAQNICLAALDYGLGTCIEDVPVTYPDAIRKSIKVPESWLFVMGIAIGYPDPEFPANRVQSGREPLAKLVRWEGFE